MEIGQEEALKTLPAEIIMIIIIIIIIILLLLLLLFIQHKIGVKISNGNNTVEKLII